MRIYRSLPTITNTTITHNSAAQGGGVFETSLNAVFNDCDISGNSATSFGGGMALLVASPTLERCTIYDNSAPQGAGMRLYRSSPAINHTAIVNNTAGTGARLGGGIACVASSRPTITNCTFNGNTANRGGAVWCYLDATVTLLNGILWDDAPQEIYIQRHATYPSTVAVDYCDVEGDEGGVYIGLGSALAWGDGNINEDPLFVGGGDYQLTVTSLCIDAGDPDSPPDPDESRADMGAYYFDQGGGGRMMALKHPETPAMSLMQPNAVSFGDAYPNPFNAATTVSFSLPDAMPVKLAIYDLQGRQVALLVDGLNPVGTHRLTWDANAVPAGVYLMRFEAPGFSKAKLLTLMK
jgi:hypothetical protein